MQSWLKYSRSITTSAILWIHSTELSKVWVSIYLSSNEILPPNFSKRFLKNCTSCKYNNLPTFIFTPLQNVEHWVTSYIYEQVNLYCTKLFNGVYIVIFSNILSDRVAMLVILIFNFSSFFFNFHDGGRYHIETSPLICSANQWTGFYLISASVVKELSNLLNTVISSTRFSVNLIIFFAWIWQVSDFFSRPVSRTAFN